MNKIVDFKCTYDNSVEVNIKSNLVFVHDQDFEVYISKKIDELEAELEM